MPQVLITKQVIWPLDLMAIYISLPEMVGVAVTHKVQVKMGTLSLAKYCDWTSIQL